LRSWQYLQFRPPYPHTTVLHDRANEKYGANHAHSTHRTPRCRACPLAGCAVTINHDGLDERNTQAIGGTVSQFATTERSQKTRSRINDNVNPPDEASYCCYLYRATGIQKAMSFEQRTQSDAICTAMAGGQSRSGNDGHSATCLSGRSVGANCNALLRAAGRYGPVIPGAKLP